MDWILYIAVFVVAFVGILVAIAVAITAPLYITAWVVAWIRQARDKRGFRIVNPQTPLALRAGDSPTDGEGVYRIQALIPQNGSEVELTLDAPTLAAARLEAERKGLRVTRVVKC